MRKKLLCLLACLVLCLPVACAEEDAFLDTAEADSVGRIVRTYDSPTLKYQMEKFKMEGEICYLTRIWVQDPARQIRKATSHWKEDVMYPDRIVKQIPETVLAVNGSGFVSPLYPEIPENYPGKNSEYFNTPLGSLTVTNGEVFRNLEGVPFYGITLEADGLHMYVGADNEEVLSHQPLQTWSFYDGCVLVREDVNMVDHEWQFANERNIRTIIGRLADDTVFVLTVTAKTNEGLTMVQSADWVIEHLHPLWAFNLDGGPSSALLVRPNRTGALKTVYGNIVKTVDIMGFCELTGE